MPISSSRPRTRLTKRLSDCSKPRGSVHAPAMPGELATLRLAISGSHVTLDPGKAKWSSDYGAMRILFSGLARVDEEMDVVPEIARSWQVLDGGRRYLFHLRDDYSWSDGSINVDYTGTSPQVGVPLNSVPNYTYAHTVYPIMTALCPASPKNDGALRPITVTAPPGLLFRTLCVPRPSGRAISPGPSAPRRCWSAPCPGGAGEGDCRKRRYSQLQSGHFRRKKRRQPLWRYHFCHRWDGGTSNVDGTSLRHIPRQYRLLLPWKFWKARFLFVMRKRS